MRKRIHTALSTRIIAWCWKRKILVGAVWLIQKTHVFLSLIQGQSEPEPEDENVLDKK
jgi:hypothetical protein